MNLRGCAMAPAGVRLAEEGVWRRVGGWVTGAGGLSRGWRVVMTQRLCTWGFEVGRKLGVEGGGLDPQLFDSFTQQCLGVSVAPVSVISTFALALCQGRELSMT